MERRSTGFLLMTISLPEEAHKAKSNPKGAREFIKEPSSSMSHRWELILIFLVGFSGHASSLVDGPVLFVRRHWC
ncbi:hypothetical protein MANES_05G085002v8 [Manihot esculenta]|uniref:Uncharacterized protein n=1 Tax=Manihot esculenta TaxID=3983 RepID=A0ACB7HPT1_MANES|nr:hypothetical protein MANES_05G085002v8 [Manihot esculenta]